MCNCSKANFLLFSGQNEIPSNEISHRKENHSIGASTGSGAEEELHREDRHRATNTRYQTYEHQH